MRTRPLGRTGIHVSPYTLGTMKFGRFGNPDHDECVRIVHRALDNGINTIDTADVYGGDGESEQIIGKALHGRRDDVVLATKFSGPMGPDPNRRGNSRRWIVSAVEASLRRLGVDHIDLYQVHHPDPDTDIEETLSALTDLLRSGKVRAIGHSNLPSSEIVAAQWVSERGGLSRFRTEHPHYSILNRGAEREIFPLCQTYGLGALVWSPLAMGLLTGRYRKCPPARRR
ncbi:putative oxidoreductase [Nocardia amikacinitolerans]|nr:putative oxidoreductase [Nocardia amikacinitolerans]